MHPAPRWAALVLTTALATAACTSTPVPPPTVRVDRGIVKTSVSASGTLVSVSEQNLGFPSAGKLAAVGVKVGDRVAPGQVLARLDDFALSITLEQRKATLAQQRAALTKVTGGNSVEAAGASLVQAKEILSATQDQVGATKESDESATSSARRQLSFSKDSLDTAEKQLRDAKSACKASTSTPTTTPAPAPAAAPVASSTTTPTPTTPASVNAIPASSTTSTACQQVTTAETAVQQAQGNVISARNAVDAAEQKENTDAAAGRLSIANATQGVVTAQNSSESAGLDKPSDTAAAAAQVRDAQAQLQGAQRDVDDAVLRAPVGGVVSAINGAVGEFVGVASGTTAQSPGSGAPLPAVASTSGTGTTTGVGGGPFIVLNNIASYQLVVPFEETDAAKIAPNQAVDVTVDAVPGLTAQGTVLAIAPTGALASGIVNYNATVLLTNGDPALRDGQTAEAAVTVDSEDNVLRVPSSTVRTEGGRSVVSTPGSDGKSASTPFTPGKVGDEFTQVQSGLTLGQEVLLPQAQVTASPATPQQPPR